MNRAAIALLAYHMPQVIIIQIPPEIPCGHFFIGRIVRVNLADGDIVRIVVQEAMHFAHEFFDFFGVSRRLRAFNCRPMALPPTESCAAPLRRPASYAIRR